MNRLKYFTAWIVQILFDIMSCAVVQRWKDQIRAESHPPVINYWAPPQFMWLHRHHHPCPSPHPVHQPPHQDSTLSLATSRWGEGFFFHSVQTLTELFELYLNVKSTNTSANFHSYFCFFHHIKPAIVKIPILLNWFLTHNHKKYDKRGHQRIFSYRFVVYILYMIH